MLISFTAPTAPVEDIEPAVPGCRDFSALHSRSLDWCDHSLALLTPTAPSSVLSIVALGELGICVSVVTCPCCPAIMGVDTSSCADIHTSLHLQVQTKFLHFFLLLSVTHNPQMKSQDAAGGASNISAARMQLCCFVCSLSVPHRTTVAQPHHRLWPAIIAIMAAARLSSSRIMHLMQAASSL